MKANRSKSRRSKKYAKKKSTRRRIQRGGDNTPKCGKEGCVYFTTDTAIKLVIEHESKIGFLLDQIEKQKRAYNNKPSLAPNVLGYSIKKCNKINILEEPAPCYVKRGIPGNPIGDATFYMNQTNPSWCVGYERNGKKFKPYEFSEESNCKIPRESYEHMLKRYGEKYALKEGFNTIDYYDYLESDENRSNDIFSQVTDEFRNLENYKSLYIIEIISERVKGLTVAELYDKIAHKYKDKITDILPIIGPEWQTEINKLNDILKSIGCGLNDLAEGNAMIDVGTSGIDIDDIIDKNQGGVTPTLIKSLLKSEIILKAIDWGM